MHSLQVYEIFACVHRLCYNFFMRKVQPLEDRLRALGGLSPLQPGEATAAARIRAPEHVVRAFLSLSTLQRGEAVETGLKALGLLGEIRDAEDR